MNDLRSSGFNTSVSSLTMVMNGGVQLHVELISDIVWLA